MKFVDSAYAVSATCRGHAIDISAPIYADSRAWARAILAAGEALEHGLLPSVRRLAELENRAASELSSQHCRALDVPSHAPSQLGIGVLTFVASYPKHHVVRVA